MEHFFIPSNIQKKVDNCRHPLFKKHIEAKKASGARLIGKTEHRNQHAIEKAIKPSGPRFIWRIITDGEISLYVLREFLLHDEYLNKYNSGNADKWPEMTALSPEEKKEVTEELNRLKSLAQDSKQEIIQLSDLTESEHLFLREQKDINKDTLFDTIYERQSWIKDINSLVKDGKTTYTSNYGTSLKQKIEDSLGDDNEMGWLTIPVKNIPEQSIAVYKQKNKVSDSGNQWILFGIITKDKNPSDKDKYVDAGDPETFLHGCRRSYPATILDDMDLWQAIEQDQYGNLILSGEENGIVSKAQEYPIFLSGRAGSGKSTVLQYLFAEIVLRFLSSSKYYEEDNLMPPVYISYSENLIESAKKLTQSLFSKNPNYRDEISKDGYNYSKDVAPLIDTELFVVFRNLIRTSIENYDPSALEQFKPENRVSFSRFKKMWIEKFAKSPQYKHYTPSLCWHIIKTYIKGWDSSKYLDPKSYENIGRDNKNVTQKDFRFVYTEIWENWYSKFPEEGLWDDQDIVRFCLHPKGNHESYVNPCFSAIFCDEAQDFTRAELEFIIKLSVFSTKQFSDPTDIARIPFVFAGDEFQTLSPTGFSWDSLRASFKEKLSEALQLDIEKVCPSEPISLNNNYRSTPSIVKLGNRLQLLRASRFGQQSSPQETYFTDNLGSPVYYFSDSDEVINRIKQMNVVLIVPADEGQSIREYIDGSSLKGKIDFYNDGSPKDITILNPAQAKGLDYPNVAIYGFGETSEELLPSNIKQKLESELSINEEKDIEPKFHLNNAYVSATRAKERLFVIDNMTKETLWQIAILESPLQASLSKLMLNKLPHKKREEWTDDKIGIIVQGLLSDITDDNNQNWEEIIKDTEKSAALIKDPEMMIQAANRYKERGKTTDEHRCRAYAATYDNNFIVAADEFVLAEMLNDAAKYYWKAISDNNIETVLEKLSNIAKKGSNSNYATLGAEIKNAKSIKEINRRLSSFIKSLSTSSDMEKSIYITLTNFLLGHISVSTRCDSQEIDVLVDLIIQLIDKGLSLKLNGLMRLLESRSKYQEIIKLGDKLKSKPREYYIAKLETTNYPDKVKYYQNSGLENWQKQIYEDFKANTTVPLTNDEVLKIVTNAIYTYSDDKIEMRKYIPIALGRKLLSYNPAEIVKRMSDIGININIADLNLFLSIQFSQYENLKKAISSGISTSLKSMAEKILVVLTPGFAFQENELKRSVKRYFDDRYISIHSILVTPLLLLLGIKMEERGIHIDSVRYYEWAIDEAHDDDKRLFRLLRLKCLESKDNEINLTDRRKLKVGSNDDVLKEIEAAKARSWERIYDHLFTKLADSQRTNTPKIEPESETGSNGNDNLSVTVQKPKEESPVDVPSIAVEQGDNVTPQEIPTAISPIIIGDLELQYNPKRHKLTIKHIKENVSIVISKGAIVGDDLTLDDKGHLMLDGKELDIMVIINEDKAILSVMLPDMSQSGASLIFQL